MQKFTIKHNGAAYEAVMNLNTVRHYSKAKGFKSLNEFGQSFENFGDDQDDMSFEMLENLGLLFHFAIKEGCRLNGDTCNITLDDVFIILETEKEKMFAFLNESMGEASDNENPQKPGARKK